MNVTLRRARVTDRAQFDWKPYGAGQHRPLVVTVDGVLYLVMEGETVVFQNGSAAIPDLVRMALRYYRSIGTLYEDREQRKAEAQRCSVEEAMEFLRG